MRDLPQISGSARTMTISSGADVLLAANQFMARREHMYNGCTGADPGDHVETLINNAAKELIVSNRVVQVLIADVNENLPLEKRLLYKGEEKFTDLTDQELFFEVPVQELLQKHNTLRAATLDKKATEKSGRDIFLDPVRIRDLKMVVVAIASF